MISWMPLNAACSPIAAYREPRRRNSHPSASATGSSAMNENSARWAPSPNDVSNCVRT